MIKQSKKYVWIPYNGFGQISICLVKEEGQWTSMVLEIFSVALRSTVNEKNCATDGDNIKRTTFRAAVVLTFLVITSETFLMLFMSKQKFL